MSETARIATMMEQSFGGDAWHGPSVRTILANVDAAAAAARPIAGAHTIGEIAGHVAAWKDVIRRRLAGEVVPGPDQDFPDATGEAAWSATRGRLEESHRRLRDAVAALPDERLSQVVAGKHYTAYVMLHGIIQHDLYHAGQMTLLKKALGI